MEKRKPHHPLRQIQDLVAVLGARAFTRTALENGAALGFGIAEMVAVVQRLSRREFYKSMTTLYDASLWQDVYHAETDRRVVYIKVTQFTDGRPPVIQFKRK